MQDPINCGKSARCLPKPTPAAPGHTQMGVWKSHESVMVLWCRVPVLSVQWFFSGTWYDMNRVGDNYFVIQAINDQALILPAQVKITSIFGDTVIDTVATSSPTVSPKLTLI